MPTWTTPWANRVITSANDAAEALPWTTTRAGHGAAAVDEAAGQAAGHHPPHYMSTRPQAGRRGVTVEDAWADRGDTIENDASEER